MTGKYVYAVIRQDDRRNLGGGGLTTVAHQGLAAVVQDKDIKDYHRLPKAETIGELISHQQIIEKIMEQFPVLPVKFGTILKNQAEIIAVLDAGYSFLDSTLRKIGDKIELDLVCFWNEPKAAQMAYQKSKKIRSWQQKITKKKQVTVEDKLALGKLAADYLAEKREKFKAQILTALKKHAVESCSHALADVNMLLNQAFLVEKKSRPAFNRALNQLDGKFDNLVNFRLVGPLPPYSFATLVVDSLDKKEVAKARETLKLNGRLSMEKLKHTYDKLAMRIHPDKGGSPAEFGRVTAAYKLLKNFTQNGLAAVSVYKWQEP